MNILLDTHAFLWLKNAPEKIPEKVLTAYYDINNEIFLSVVSIWEMQIKHQLDEAANAENLPSNSHAIKQLKYNLKPSIRGIV